MPRQGETASPYVVVHMLPDLRVKSTQMTRVFQNTLSPQIDETFIFSADEMRPDLEIHVSAWHSTETGDDVFMGHSSIPVRGLQPNTKSDKWYTLLPKPGHIENLSTLLEKRKKKRGNKDLTKPKMFALALQTADLEAAVSAKTKIPHKFVDVKLTSLSYCGHCSGIMWALSAQMQCKECRMNCHVRCSKFIANNCGGVGMIRLRIKLSTMPVLPMAKYEKFLSVLSKNSYAVCTLLGKVSQEREEAARTLVRITDNRQQVVQFLKDVLSNEVNAASDSMTLFRANSMASKAVDVYMKHIGLPYLKSVLSPVIESIVSANKSCEVDPARLDKNEKLDVNWKSLTGYMNVLLNNLFGTTHNIPLTLRDIFSHLQQAVVKKFPKDPSVKYTAIGGFIVLRFFAAAVLGPKLFGLVDEYLDTRASRTLTLLAKSLQNLANLVEFGMKEPYMSPMNDVIKARLEEMKKYIDAISDPKAVKRASQLPPVDNTNLVIAKEAARAFDLFVRASDKMMESVPTEHKSVMVDLLQELREISQSMDGTATPDEVTSSGVNAAKIKQSGDDEEAAPRAVFNDQTSSAPTADIDEHDIEIRRRTQSVAMRPNAAQMRSPSRTANTVSFHESMLGYGSSQSSGSDVRTASGSDVRMTSGIHAGPESKPAETASATTPAAQAKMTRQQLAMQQLQAAMSAVNAAGSGAIGVCESCKQPINSMGELMRGFDKCWHTSHFACSVCSTQLGNSDPPSYVNDKLFCGKHIPGPKSFGTCAACDDDITTAFIDALDRRWHKECFACTACGIELSNSFVPFEGMPYCKEDYLKRAGLICGVCGEYIDTEYIEVFGRKYHTHCRKCDHCNASLAGRHYFSLNGNIMCTEHRDQFMNCHGCKQPIQGPVLVAMKKQHQFHPEHFTCTSCRRGLSAAPFFEKDDTPFCQNCWFQANIADLNSNAISRLKV